MNSMDSRDIRNAVAIWAAMGLTACGLVDAVDDAAEKITGTPETCTDTYRMDVQTGGTDTITICKVDK